MIIIGITGPIASGKRVLTDYLIKNYGFTTFSLSTIVHDEVKKRGIREVTRKVLQDVGNDLREKYGQDILARRALKIIKNQIFQKTENRNPKTEIRISDVQFSDNQTSVFRFPKHRERVIIEGIRNPAEVVFFRSNSRFKLISIKSNREYRFKRILTRNKPWDPKKWQDFIAVDRRDLGENESQTGQQVKACMKMADYTLTNNGTVEEFEKKVEKVMKKIEKQASLRVNEMTKQPH